MVIGLNHYMSKCGVWGVNDFSFERTNGVRCIHNAYMVLIMGTGTGPGRDNIFIRAVLFLPSLARKRGGGWVYTYTYIAAFGRGILFFC